MCCLPRHHQSVAGPYACYCGCMPVRRSFISSQEERDRLAKYKEELKKELTGVEERIKELG